MKKQFEVKYTQSNTPYIVGIHPFNHFSNDDVNYLKSIGNPDKVFIEMVHSNGDFDYPKKYIPKLHDGCVILIRDEVEQDGMDCKVVMLPRDCKTLMKNDLYKIADHVSGDRLFMIDRTTSLCNLWQPQHLYFTSNEQIKEGDWCMYNDGGSKDIRKAVRCYNGRVYFSETTFAKKELLIKIIACTDLSLPLPSIPISWIKDVYVPSHGKVDMVKVVDPKKALTKNGVVIILQDEVENTLGEMIDEKAIYKSEFNETETSLIVIPLPTPTQSDISLDVAELKKAIQLKNEGWADSLEFKIWSLAYENNSEDNYRSVIEEIEKLQPKIIEQNDVDKVESRVIATLEASVSDLENRLYKASVDNAKLMAKLQQSHPPVTSMSVEEWNIKQYGKAIFSKAVHKQMQHYASYVLANSSMWSDEQLCDLIDKAIKNLFDNGVNDKESIMYFITQYKQK